MSNPIASHAIAAGNPRRRAGCAMPMSPEQAENRGTLWVIGAFAFCPCHLPLTLALIAAVLSGTTAGVLLRDHPLAAGAVITTVWAAGTWRGLLYFRSAKRYARVPDDNRSSTPHV